MNSLNQIPILKKGGIHIKKENIGSFTRYCGGNVTQECIERGKNSPSAAIRKKSVFADNARRWKHENGGILKAQEGTGNLYAPHPLSPVGIALNQAKAMAKMKGEQHHLPPGVKEVVGPDGKKVAIRTEQPLVPLEQSIAEWLPGTGDVAEVGYIADDVKNGNYGSAALTAAMVALPGNVGKIFRKSDVPTSKSTKVVIEESKPRWANTSQSKLSEAERLGIPKGQRSNPKALDNPQYWGYKQWNERYNAAVRAGNWEEVQRLRDLHFMSKAPDTKVIDENGIPLEIYHFSHNPRLQYDLYPDKRKPLYLTSSKTGEEIYYPLDASSSQKRRSYYLKMNNPLQEIHEAHVTPRMRDSEHFKKQMQRSESAREEILNYWRNKRMELDNLSDEAWLAGNKDLSSKYGKQAFDLSKKYILPHVSREIPLKWKDLYYPDFDFYDLLSNELRSDGVIHDIWKTRHYLTYNPENIKLSKAITFDDNGEIIPIVKRDNFRNLDTRYNKGGKL